MQRRRNRESACDAPTVAATALVHRGYPVPGPDRPATSGPGGDIPCRTRVAAQPDRRSARLRRTKRAQPLVSTLVREHTSAVPGRPTGDRLVPLGLQMPAYRTDHAVRPDPSGDGGLTGVLVQDRLSTNRSGTVSQRVGVVFTPPLASVGDRVECCDGGWDEDREEDDEEDDGDREHGCVLSFLRRADRLICREASRKNSLGARNSDEGSVETGSSTVRSLVLTVPDILLAFPDTGMRQRHSVRVARWRRQRVSPSARRADWSTL
jgi:hypothetical protein